MAMAGSMDKEYLFHVLYILPDKHHNEMVCIFQMNISIMPMVWYLSTSTLQPPGF